MAEQTALKALLEPILDKGIRNTNFFNGRLLSGEDLAQEQDAIRQSRQWIGQGLGEGVAFGLEVAESVGVSTSALPVVTVRAGMAVNRRGQLLPMSDDIDLSLVRSAAGNGAAVAAMFTECEPPQAGVYVAGDGVYILTVAPASGRVGRAPVSGLGNIPATCNARYLVEGVQFRLIQVPVNAALLADAARVRNRLAYASFGVADTAAFGLNPFGAVVSQYGLIDRFRVDQILTDCEVPLAALYWTAATGIVFVDRWAVRRPLTPRSTSGRWPLLVDARRAAEAEAMFLQFEDHIDDIRAEGDVRSLAATDRFDFLPPIGFLPLTATDRLGAFDAQTFFRDRAARDVAFTDARLVRSLFHEALQHEPIALSDGQPVQLYLVFDNVQSVERGETDQLAIIFASGALPYRGVARFGYARWDLSRVASVTL